MLPMILGFLGSAFAPAIGSALGLASLTPLVAGAVGQGLGTAIQQKDLGAGLKAGLGSFAGGKLLGGLMGSTAGGAAAGQVRQGLEVELPKNDNRSMILSVDELATGGSGMFCWLVEAVYQALLVYDEQQAHPRAAAAAAAAQPSCGGLLWSFVAMASNAVQQLQGGQAGRFAALLRQLLEAQLQPQARTMHACMRQRGLLIVLSWMSCVAGHQLP